MMNTLLVWSSVLAALAGMKVQAAGENLLSCRNSGYTLSRCTLIKAVFAEPILEDGTYYETEYTIAYDFVCRGHSVDVGVSTGQQYVPFMRGASAVLRATGTGRVETHDPSPQSTQRLSFMPGCSLSVSSVTVFPSSNTLLLWTSQAHAQAKIIGLSLKLYLLAKDYQALSDWDRSKLMLMRDKLQSLTQAYPANLHYRVMLDTVNNALDHAPPPYSHELIASAGQDVVLTLRAELDTEVERGRGLVNRFLRWQLQAEQTLLDAVESVPES